MIFFDNQLVEHTPTAWLRKQLKGTQEQKNRQLLNLSVMKVFNLRFKASIKTGYLFLLNTAFYVGKDL